MNRHWLASIAALSMIASAAGSMCAAEPTAAGSTDARMRTIDYDPQAVVQITGVYRTATQVLFGENETILHVALGDSTAWDVAVEKNILFIKPKAAHGLTNLIVTTGLPGGGTHNYTFELTVGPAGKTPGLFVLRFHYSADLKVQATAVISAEEQVLLAKITALKLERGAIEGHRNLAYEVQGVVSLQPSEVSDNGRFTVLRFPAGQAIPAVYQVTPDGSESLVPFDVRGEFVVIHGTAKQFRLRRGADVLCIYNNAPESYGLGLGTNTASSDVDRTDIGAPPAKSGVVGTEQP